MKNNKTYKVQNGCWNCKYVFVYYEYDISNLLYCHFDKSSRPLSDSVFMQEFPTKLPKENYKRFTKKISKLFTEWQNWSEPREVDTMGICNNYLKKD